MADTKRVAVIGSGFGGLAAAIRLQAAGADTVLFEARDKPGGRAYVYEERGFTFDAGPTVITAPQCLDELFELGGKRREAYVEFLPITPFYRLIWQDGTRIDYAGGDGLLQEVERLCPDDKAGYLRFVDYSRRVFDKGFTDLAHVPFLRFADMLKVAPSLARLRADRSVFDAVSGFVKNDKLREALSFHALLVGGNPFETSSIYTLIHYLERNFGVFFPRGGTGALVAALVKLYTELGGELRLSCPVRGVRIERTPRLRHLVDSGEGEAEPFDAVVSNSDLHHTYSTLYAAEPGAQKMTKKLE
jgi:phytoene desaturase